ncbi:hypothetical protein LIER_29157 [Lithospermum erythrorhizon]|uniref:Uncharacterized protein n=1 Tax=Lithospermum erythrorhizon TaxID=34254 RepID=A0AAV3RNB0_LITER
MMRRFVFDNRWVGKEGCEEVVRKAWAKEFRGSRWFQSLFEGDHCDKDEVMGLERELDEACGEEEKYWRLRSKEKHLKDEDKNSKFFHMSTKLTCRKYLILGMEDGEGPSKTGADNVEAIVLDYFRTIFSANELCHPELVTTHVERRVTEAMNQRLTRADSSDEVKRTVLEMPADKTPGPDGMTQQSSSCCESYPCLPHS